MLFSEFKRRRKEKKENKNNNFYTFISRQLMTTSKALIWIFAINSIVWIYFSYLLAFLGRDNIAEALSSNVCQVIIGQLVFYLITKTVENVFKYNNFGGMTNPYLLRKEAENNGNDEEQSGPNDINDSDNPVNEPIIPSGSITNQPIGSAIIPSSISIAGNTDTDIISSINSSV